MKIQGAKLLKRADGTKVIEVTATINGTERLFAFPTDKSHKDIKAELEKVEEAEKLDAQIAEESAEAEKEDKQVEKTIKNLTA